MSLNLSRLRRSASAGDANSFEHFSSCTRPHQRAPTVLDSWGATAVLGLQKCCLETTEVLSSDYTIGYQASRSVASRQHKCSLETTLLAFEPPKCCPETTLLLDADYTFFGFNEYRHLPIRRPLKASERLQKWSPAISVPVTTSAATPVPKASAPTAE